MAQVAHRGGFPRLQSAAAAAAQIYTSIVRSRTAGFAGTPPSLGQFTRKLHPMAGFKGRRKGRGKRLTRKKRGIKASKGSRKRYNNTRVANTKRKIALAVQIPLTHDIELDLTQNIIGGATASNVLWNNIVQGIANTQRVGDSVRRTGLWMVCEFTRGLAQGSTEFNPILRVIFAKQKGHGNIPTTAAAVSNRLPAWPTFSQCLSREWHREYTLVKDTRVRFGLRQGTAPDAICRVQKVWKFAFNQKCTWDAGSDNMDMGRFYMYVTCPDAVPATAADLRVVVRNYCNYFVDEL